MIDNNFTRFNMAQLRGKDFSLNRLNFANEKPLLMFARYT